MNRNDKENKREISVINKYLKKKRVNPLLKENILDYLDQIHE
jgi:hypothetical protein